MEAFSVFSNAFLNEAFWLPPNTTWSIVNEYRTLDLDHLFTYPVAAGIVLYILRLIFENLVAKPFGRLMGIVDWPIKYKKGGFLEAAYSIMPKPTEDQVKFIAEQNAVDIKYVKGWFKWRNSLKKTPKIVKFAESFWRFTFYLGVWFYGFYVLYPEPWLWDNELAFKGYPFTSVSGTVYSYYAIEVGFYLSLIFSQFTDVKRKDFWLMFLHHVVTISLILFSYVCNFVRVGTLVLILHDTTDFWLELAKMGTYAPRMQPICDLSFIIFAVSWFVTRLVAYPLKILYLTSSIALRHIGMFPAYYVFNVLLYILQVMHVIWFYMILRVAYNAILCGNVQKDARSESEDSDSEPEPAKDKKAK